MNDSPNRSGGHAGRAGADAFAFGSPSSRFGRPVVGALLLAVLTFALFAPAIGYEFLNYDDNLYVYENRGVLQGAGWAGLRYALTTFDAGTWAPVTWLSYQIDTSLMGPQPRSYHLTNILLHVGAGVALFFAMVRLLKSLWAAVLVAGVFLFHPLRNESVVWIAERKDVLFALFWMLGLPAYERYAARPSLRRWGVVFGWFLLGVMSKMMMVTFPFALLLLDWWPLNRAGASRAEWRARVWPLVREKIPFFIVSALAVFVTSRALNSVGTLHPVKADAGATLAQVLANYAFYVRKIFWPAELSILYPPAQPDALATVTHGLALAAVTAFAVWRARRWPWLIVGWLWFLGTLVPVIGLVGFGHFTVADRYTHVPSVGLTLAAAVALDRLTRGKPPLRLAIPAVALGLCALATWADLPRWKNSFALYNSALAVGPHHVTYNNRGTAYLAIGDPASAVEDFTQALALKPDHASALLNRASAWIELGQFDRAVADCTKAIQFDPRAADAWNNRGNALSRLGRFDEALADYNQAITLNPARALYYNNRAAGRASLKDFSGAQADIEMCRRLGGRPHPGLVEAVRAAAETGGEKQP